MKVWTSYFAKIDKLRLLGFNDFIAVSGYIPEFYKEAMNNNPLKKFVSFRRILEFSPKKDWFFEWKNGKFGNDEYIKLYKETVLNKLNSEQILKELKENSVLLCYEKPNDFCHRHLIAEWLREELNIECSEVDLERDERLI